MVVNIVGRGTGWEDAPRDELSWGITLINLQRPVNLVIDMNFYDDGRWGEEEKNGAIKSRELALKAGIPYIDLKTYPIGEIESFFKTDYFGSTVDYAIALAIYSGFSEIRLYGINMINGNEYSYQKPSAEFWIGVAMGRGIKVERNSKLSNLLKTKDGKLYGYDTPQKDFVW